MEVAQIDFGRSWRGGQQQLLLLVRALEPLGWRSMVVTPAPELAARWRREGLEAMAPRAAWARLRRVAVVHAHDGRALGWALGWALGQRWLGGLGDGVPPVLASRRVAFPLTRAGAWKWRRPARVLAVSQFLRQQLLHAGLQPEQVAVVADAVATEGLPEPHAARHAVRARLGIAPARLCLTCVGALTAEKGVGDLLPALPRLPDLRPLLLLTGEGGRQARLQAQARRLGVAPQVIWAAGRCSVPEAVAAADQLIVPSRQEGFGSAILLAWALGRVVVATQVGGIPELISHGHNGLLVPAADPAALAIAIRAAAVNDAQRERFLAAGRAALDGRYQPAAMAAATAEAYRTALAGRQ